MLVAGEYLKDYLNRHTKICIGEEPQMARCCPATRSVGSYSGTTLMFEFNNCCKNCKTVRTFEGKVQV